MPSMSYCRFENTLQDMREAYDVMQNLFPEVVMHMSASEFNCMCRLVNLCDRISHDKHIAKLIKERIDDEQ